MLLGAAHLCESDQGSSPQHCPFRACCHLSTGLCRSWGANPTHGPCPDLQQEHTEAHPHSPMCIHSPLAPGSSSAPAQTSGHPQPKPQHHLEWSSSLSCPFPSPCLRDHPRDPAALRIASSLSHSLYLPVPSLPSLFLLRSEAGGVPRTLPMSCPGYVPLPIGAPAEEVKIPRAESSTGGHVQAVREAVGGQWGAVSPVDVAD